MYYANLIDPTTANIAPDLEHLKTLVDEAGENGVSFEKNGSTYSSTNIAATTSLSMALPAGGDVYAGAHTHPNWGAYPMFSWGDVFALFQMYGAAATNVKNEVTLFLVAREDILSPNVNVYAITINDFSSFRNQIQADMNSIRNDPRLPSSPTTSNYYDVLNEDFGSPFETANNIERSFLDSFKNHNISLSKANEDLTNWSKLTIPESSIDIGVTETPCN